MIAASFIGLLPLARRQFDVDLERLNRYSNMPVDRVWSDVRESPLAGCLKEFFPGGQPPRSVDDMPKLSPASIQALGKESAKVAKTLGKLLRGLPPTTLAAFPTYDPTFKTPAIVIDLKDDFPAYDPKTNTISLTAKSIQAAVFSGLRASLPEVQGALLDETDPNPAATGTASDAELIAFYAKLVTRLRNPAPIEASRDIFGQLGEVGQIRFHLATLRVACDWFEESFLASEAYLIAHEIGHAALRHERVAPGPAIELEADRIASLTLGNVYLKSSLTGLRVNNMGYLYQIDDRRYARLSGQANYFAFGYDHITDVTDDPSYPSKEARLDLVRKILADTLKSGQGPLRSWAFDHQPAKGYGIKEILVDAH